jgi:para-nitrobenzyl esterase
MASPLSRDLIAGAIGESGALAGTFTPVPLAKAEEEGSKFAASIGAQSLAALRAMSAQEILEPAYKGGYAAINRFPIAIDGYFLPADPVTIYASGKQARIPLLAGWNSEEVGWQALFGKDEPTPQNYTKVLAKLYGPRADEALKFYPASTRDEVVQAATDLAGDRSMGYSTWKWIDLHVRTSGARVYRYLYARPRPAQRTGNHPAARGAVHSAEIEYALGNLALNDVYAWTPDDYKVSAQMQNYFANFIKKFDPHGPGLPEWPAMRGDNSQVMRLDVESRVEPDSTRPRYLFLDQLTKP